MQKNLEAEYKQIMSVYDEYNEIGRNNIKATSSDFINMVGEEGVKDIVKKVFLGDNVRDVTEFITQRRLINSYSAMLELYLKTFNLHNDSIKEFIEFIAKDLQKTKGDAKLLDLWLLGLTKKGLDNIVRTEENIVDYQFSFESSVNDTVEDLKKSYGELSGTIEMNGSVINLNWNIMVLMFIAIGAQTLSIRGSAKSMNGKMFEKLVLGALLTVLGFTFLSGPPCKVDKTKRLFWLSNMDENERETDATVIYNGKAISIDIGFIGKGNPEITLDKVTRFGAYKRIGGIPHDMATVIIVDTIGENSDLFKKAKRVNGYVLQMNNNNWTTEFAKTICEIMDIEHELSNQRVEDLENYFDEKLKKIDMKLFMR